MNHKFKQLLADIIVEAGAWIMLVLLILGVAGCVMLVLRCLAGIFYL
jgi:F0F1-type ATP synthase assembly protein I